jgi:hypothetical protein
MPTKARPKPVTFAALAATPQTKEMQLGVAIASLRTAGFANVRDALQQPEKLRKALGKPDELNRRALGLIKLAHAAGDAEIAARVLRIAGPSLAAIGRLPAGFLRSKLGKLDRAQARAVGRLRRASRAVYRIVAEVAAVRQAAKSSGGGWQLHYDPRPHKPDPDASNCFDCECCDGVFGPRAYLFDLLDLIYYRWPLPTFGLEGGVQRITSDVLEKVLFQEIDGLVCARGKEVVLQVRIACEVLERLLGDRIPLGSAEWRTDYRIFWASVLAPGSDPEAAIAALAPLDTGGGDALSRLVRALAVQKPSLVTIDQASQAIDELAQAPDALPAATALREVLEAPDFSQRNAALRPRLSATYRRHLLTATGETAASLGPKLFIDLLAGECMVTTRFTQLILSLQDFILAIRTGAIAALGRPDLVAGAVIDFGALDARAIDEEEWKWLGDYPRWKAAIYTLVFPENVLPPPITDPRLEALAQDWSKGVSPRDVRDGFLKVLFGPLLSTAAAMDTGLSNRVLDTRSFPRNYGSLDAWIADAQQLAGQVPATVSDARFPPATNNPTVYLRFPLLAAWALGRSGEFAAAHDWYRRLYDPNRPRNERVRFDFDTVLESGSGGGPDTIRPGGGAWLDDPLDPRLIALRRRGVYLRHVVLAMVRNLLDWADHEFAHETAETVDRARSLYLLARRTLDAENYPISRCDEAISSLELDIVVHQAHRKLLRQRPRIRAGLRRLRAVRKSGILHEAIAEIRGALAKGDDGRVVRRVDAVVRRAVERDAKERPAQRTGESLARRRTRIDTLEDELLAGFPPDPGPGPDPGPDPGPVGGGFGPGDIPGKPGRPFDWFLEDPEIKPGLPDDDDLGTVDGRDVPTAFEACIPVNPLLVSLRQHIEANLAKIRGCLSIAGEPLRLALASCDPAAGAAAPRGGGATDQAPRYRYNFLVEKARQYVDVAQRLESALLQAIEKREDARFDTLKARQAADLAGATVELRSLQVREAESGQAVAEAQLDRANVGSTFWDVRIGDAETFEANLSDLEREGLQAIERSIQTQQMLKAAFALQGLGAVAAASVIGGLALPAALPFIVGEASAAASEDAATASLKQTNAAYERRFEEWKLQRDLAQADVAIADAVVIQAADRVAVAEQEEQIARLQLTQAQEVIEFLSTRLDDVELFEWMIDVLVRNYRTVMQLSTSVARLAQRALEFERQEPIQIILTDYWTITSTSALAANLSEEQGSFGLLASERLLTDLTKLDAFKLQTEARRLQMTKTVSLAQMLPVELALLRRDGRVTFNTLLDWFDRDFPGHYLRLIRSVRVSVLALIPPVDGIHAVLHNSGESTVVVPVTDEVTRQVRFAKRRALRNFGETIALDGAFNESGLFELRSDDPMLLPFETLGVETQWTIELPQAFNRFIFSTIADVLLHIDYTALLDFGYRAEVIGALPAFEKRDCPFDLGFAFPDEWYQLKNPRSSDPPADRPMPFTLPRLFFPPQYAPAPAGGGPALELIHVALIVVGDFTALSDPQREVLRTSVEITKDGLTLSTAAVSAPGSPAWRFAKVFDRSAFFTTREAPAALSPTQFPLDPLRADHTTTDASGLWTLTLGQPIFEQLDDQGQPLIRRIVDAVLILTVQGHVQWS